MSKQAKINWVRWKDVCQSLLMAGAMKDFSRSECRRVATLLRNGVAAGTVLHKKEGSKSYWAIEPSKFAEATKP